MENLAKLISVVTYDDESKLFISNDKSIGFAFICNPLSSASNIDFINIKNLLNFDLPDDSYLSIALTTHNDLSNEILSYQEKRFNCDNEILNWLNKQQCEEIKQYSDIGTKHIGGQILKNYLLLISIKIPVKDISRETLRKYSVVQQQYQANLIAAKLFAVALNDTTWLYYMQVILNSNQQSNWSNGIKLDENRLLNQQLLDYDNSVEIKHRCLNIADKYVSTYSVNNWPDELSFGNAISYIGDMLSGYSPYNGKFLLCCNIHYLSQGIHKQKLKAKHTWTINQSFSSLINFVPRIGQTRKSFDNLFTLLDEGDKLFSVNWTLNCWHENEQKMLINESKIKAYFQTIGFVINNDRFINLSLFINSLPLCVDLKAKVELHRYKSFCTSQLATILPLFCEWKASNSYKLPIISRHGQLMGIDNFDSNTNFNCCIAAQTGSGKSFLVNEMITNLLSTNGQCWIIDVGRSYEKLVNYYNGQLISFNINSDINLSPFLLINDFEKDIDLVIIIIITMISESGDLCDFQTNVLKETIFSLWDNAQENINLEMLSDSLKTHNDSRIKDMGVQLYTFTNNKYYGKLFNKSINKNYISKYHTEKNIFNHQFCVLELEELSNSNHLKQVVLLQLILSIQQQMYLGNLNKQKVLFIDEAWELLIGDHIAKFIEAGYRRFRKYNGAVVTITQSLDDLHNNISGQAIFANSANIYLLGQRKEVINQLIQNNRLSLDKVSHSYITSLRTIPKAYSEIYFITNYGCGVGRLIVNRFKQLLYSTNAKEVYAIRNYIENGYSIPDAINKIIEQETQD